MPIKKKITKPAKKKPSPKKDEAALPVKAERFTEAVGRRKTSTARARIFAGSGAVKINERDPKQYFPTEELQGIIEAPFKKVKPEKGFSISVKVFGGGIHSQAEAVRHAISRALIKSDSELRKKLKRAGFLKRDPRAKERRKFGLKKARKAPQWSKR